MGDTQHINHGDLLILLKQGDVRAFDNIYKFYSPRLYRFAYNRIGSVEDAEEIIQEAFLWLWENRKNLQHIQALYPYLQSVVKNAIIRHHSRNALHEKYTEAFRLFAVYFDNSSEELQALDDVQAEIERSISVLPERAQMAFRLSRFEHVPISEIAERMKISPRTAENYISSALKHLRISLGKASSVALAMWLGL
ncbi:MAG: RNA polymerase sigma-70 factor [Bacteroidota bacterium]